MFPFWSLPGKRGFECAISFMDLFPFSVLQVIVLLVHSEERCTHRIRDALATGNGTGIKSESASLWVGKRGYTCEAQGFKQVRRRGDQVYHLRVTLSFS
jgi:hypothetical protein